MIDKKRLVGWALIAFTGVMSGAAYADGADTVKRNASADRPGNTKTAAMQVAQNSSSGQSSGAGDATGAAAGGISDTAWAGIALGVIAATALGGIHSSSTTSH